MFRGGQFRRRGSSHVDRREIAGGSIMYAPFVIEPFNDSQVIHAVYANSDIRAIPGRWYATCGAVVGGLVLESDLVDGVRCRKCQARANKYTRK